MKSFTKQSSFESPYRSSGSNGQETDSPKQLNRSLTISGRRTSGAPAPRRSRDPNSPLKRFTRAKDAISRAFGLIRDRLQESQSFMQQAQSENTSLITTLLERTRGIEDILSRDHMKVAFFGRTSNGKSTVINALLRDKVLPAGIGHTTNCFCSVRGVEGEEGYLLSPVSKEQQNVKNVTQLAHSLYKEHLEPSSLVEVFWPKTKCPLLKDDVELVDSPGVDMNPNMDEWINKHCLDADVFVLVANAESTLMTAEKKFFHRVSERLSKPNIFILNNRWDCSAQEPDMMDEVEAQHLECDVDFLTKELKVSDEETAKNRVFFVSAKEVLQVRMQQQQGKGQPSKEAGRGLADGWRARLMAFDRFERLFMECVSSAAIMTKFEHHHKQGSDVVKELEQLLDKEEKNIKQKSESNKSGVQHSSQRQLRLHSRGSEIREMCQQEISSTKLRAEQSLSIDMKDVMSQLVRMVDGYGAEFKPEQVNAYKEGLYKWVDEQLVERLKVGVPKYSKMYADTQKKLIDSYQGLLQLPEEELSRFSMIVGPPELNYVLKCSDLCEDFKEDLEFHFSFFGLGKLLAPLFGSVKGQLSPLWSVVPTEYAIPGLLLLGGALLPKLWKIALPSLALYGGVYAYEKITWSDRSKKEALNSQFVDHMRDKMSTQIRATSASYTAMLSGSLGLLLNSLHGAVEKELKRESSKISELQQEQSTLTQLQDRARKLRNAVHLLENDFEDFREEYLEDQDIHE